MNTRIFNTQQIWGKLKSTIAVFVGSSIVLSLSQLAGGIFSVFFINPLDLGLWHTAKLLNVYSAFLLGGIINGLNRELPFNLGKKDTSVANNLASTALAFTNLASIIVLIAGAFWIFYSEQQNLNLKTAIAITILIVSLGFYNLYLIVTYRSNRAFRRLANIQYIVAFVNLLTLPSIAIWGFQGLICRALFCSCISTGLYWLYRPIRVPAKFSRPALFSLFQTGIPIFGLDYVKNIASTASRIALLKFGGFEMVGQFAIARTATQSMSSLPASFSQYTNAKSTFDYGRGADLKHLWSRALRNATLCFGACSLIAIVGWIVIAPIVHTFVPEYSAGIFAAKLAMLVAVFESGRVLVNVVWSIKNWRLMTSYQVLSSACLALSPFILLWWVENVLNAVAGGLLIGSIVRFATAIYIAYIATHNVASSSERT